MCSYDTHVNATPGKTQQSQVHSTHLPPLSHGDGSHGVPQQHQPLGAYAPQYMYHPPQPPLQYPATVVNPAYTASSLMAPLEGSTRTASVLAGFRGASFRS